MAASRRWWQSATWWLLGFPVLGMIVWGCGSVFAQIGWTAWFGGSNSVPRPLLPLLLGSVVYFGCIGLLFSAAVSAGAGLVHEFAKSAPSDKRGALAVLCALGFLAPVELAVFCYGLPMGDGPVNNFGLGFTFRLPWASPYAHAALVGFGAWFGVRAKDETAEPGAATRA
ncbi:hypothetical protein [Segniliparus rugosus]|uniref:Uncharacterized protein n=1 Tax=Segniliparus rugosus (strain ATCC BAA-974 / DSM 45345 / CCUG 50838 / CIP 108380 / JCM 13579 / CDC 945) TaxID=679197 RepID=E5XPR3_SEGRC|nr:hypothetical protein [Segniliparus rugosus]EFV13661.1 hypothetical protein HMPREF9336_01485 [Segniliparus rugosus ATCC BAA-974]